MGEIRNMKQRQQLLLGLGGFAVGGAEKFRLDYGEDYLILFTFTLYLGIS